MKPYKRLFREELSEDPKIYVASLSDYNGGRLVGKWFDLSNYTDADDLLEDIQNMLKEITAKSRDGEIREEWAIHDTDNIPRGTIGEHSGKEDLQKVIDILKTSKEANIPFEVIAEFVSDTGSDLSSVSEAYEGEYENKADYVHHVIDDIGVADNYLESWLEMSPTDVRVYASEEADALGLDEEETEEKRVEIKAELEKDPVGYFKEQGLDMDSIKNICFVDTDRAWNDLRMDISTYSHNGKLYVFRDL